jgi:uncharacterized membrane-anchored protein
MHRVTGPDAVGSEGSHTAWHKEAAVTGLILLVVIGAVIAWAWVRLRGRMKLNISAKNWIGPVIVVVVLGLMLWASHTGG